MQHSVGFFSWIYYPQYFTSKSIQYMSEVARKNVRKLRMTWVICENLTCEQLFNYFTFAVVEEKWKPHAWYSCIIIKSSCCTAGCQLYIWLAMSGQSGTTVWGNIEYIYWLVKDDEFDDDSWLNLVEIDFTNFVMNILFFGN